MRARESHAREARKTVVDNVVFVTDANGPAVTTFVSKSESLPDVLQAIAEFCESLAAGGGPTDFRITFNVATCPNDFIRGEIEWVGF